MYNQPWGYPYPPQQPIYIPNPPATDPVEQITRWQVALEQMKKTFKEEKKEEKKDKDDKKGTDPGLINMMLLMVLISPITGPIMSHFFQWGLSLLPH